MRYSLIFLAGMVFAILCFVIVNAAMVPVSKSEYCGSKCHEMQTTYQTWKISEHGANQLGIRVECIDCHLPAKDKYFTHTTAKAYLGARDVYKHYFGGEYDAEKTRKKVIDEMPSQRCLHCHNDILAKSGSSIAEKDHIESLKQPETAENRCVYCHENIGHERD